MTSPMCALLRSTAISARPRTSRPCLANCQATTRAGPRQWRGSKPRGAAHPRRIRSPLKGITKFMRLDWARRTRVNVVVPLCPHLGAFYLIRPEVFRDVAVRVGLDAYQDKSLRLPRGHSTL